MKRCVVLVARPHAGSTWPVSLRRMAVVVVVGTRASAASQAGELSLPLSHGCRIATSPDPSGSRAVRHQRWERSAAWNSAPRALLQIACGPAPTAASCRCRRAVPNTGGWVMPEVGIAVPRAPDRRAREIGRRSGRGRRCAGSSRRPTAPRRGAPARERRERGRRWRSPWPRRPSPSSTGTGRGRSVGTV